MKKKIIFLFCAFLSTVTFCIAQDNVATKAERRAEMIKKATERMKNELSLTEEQAQKIEALNTEYLPKMRQGRPHFRNAKGMRPDSVSKDKKCPKKCSCSNDNTEKCDTAKIGKCKEVTKEEMDKKREEMRSIRKEYNDKLNEILTPEQQEKYKSLRKAKGKKQQAQN